MVVKIIEVEKHKQCAVDMAKDGSYVHDMVDVLDGEGPLSVAPSPLPLRPWVLAPPALCSLHSLSSLYSFSISNCSRVPPSFGSRFMRDFRVWWMMFEVSVSLRRFVSFCSL
jgi:hypothetical protein